MLLFFFQAEDGIRDWSVTGVQTCALPISWLSKSIVPRWVSSMIFLEIESPSPVPTPTAFVVKPPAKIFGPSSGRMPRPVSEMRSEERRVGKECRDQWWREYEGDKRHDTMV